MHFYFFERLEPQNVFCYVYPAGLVKGVVLEREKFFVKVQLISPFKSWENYSMISGLCKQTPFHFLTKRGNKVIERLLIESFRKTETLFDSLDRNSNVYENDL